MRRPVVIAIAAVLSVAAVVQVVQANRRDPVRPITAAIRDSFPTVRSPTAWPFTWSSIWNMPIGSDAKLVPAPLDKVNSFGADENVLILQPTAPTISVHDNAGGSATGATPCAATTGAQRGLFTAPVPFTFTTTDAGAADAITALAPAKRPNGAVAILSKNARTLLQAQPFVRCSTGQATAQHVFPIDDLVSGSGQRGAHRATQMSSLGGTLRVNDLRPGSTIRHALQIEVDPARLVAPAPGAVPPYRWPALPSTAPTDVTPTGTNAALKLGALLALPPSYRIDTLKSEPGRIIARALQEYGSYLIDYSRGTDVALTTEWGPAGRTSEDFLQDYGTSFAATSDACTKNCDWRDDIVAILGALTVVDDNGPTSVGGRGRRRVPCAPAFADGSGGAPSSCEREGLIAPTRTVRVMPLGDSLTEGGGIGGHVSYRAALFNRLKDEGYRVDFVGTQKDPVPGVADPDNEGHGGFTIGPDTDRYCTRSQDGTYSCQDSTFNVYDHVEGWLTDVKPDVVLLLVGVNDNFVDVVQPGTDGIVRTQAPSDAPEKLAALVGKIRRASPQATVIVASLVPTERDAVWPAVPRLRSTAISLAALSDGHIRFADLASVVLDPQDYAPDDQIHLSASGAAKVAEAWLVPLRSVLDDFETTK